MAVVFIRFFSGVFLDFPVCLTGHRNTWIEFDQATAACSLVARDILRTKRERWGKSAMKTNEKRKRGVGERG
jgi:hypothetical protein